MRRALSPLLSTLLILPFAHAQQAGTNSADSSAGAPVEVPAAEMAQRAIHRATPSYPRDAREAGVQGSVILNAIINTDGTVKTVSVDSGPDMLRSAAIDAAQQFTYRPYLKDGQPVVVDTTIKINFNLAGPALGGMMRGAPSQPSQSPAIDKLTQTPPHSNIQIQGNNDSSVAEGLRAPSPQGAPPKTPVRIAGGVIAGNILTKTAPRYPAEARDNHIQGTVVLHALISRDGNIKNLTVVSGPEPLQAAAVDAVKNWTYRPYLLNGEPTEVDTTIMVNFHLNTPAQPPPSPTVSQ